jgi:catechol 2,3-dioxygenase-like lactoylglutathione lyase family enzyme
MISSISHTGIYVLDQDEALEFYVGKLGLEVSADVDLGVMRWLTVRVPGSDFDVLLERPGPPAHDDATAEQVRELVTKGALGLALILRVDDAREAYERMLAAGVDVQQEPTEMPYGIDFGIRDPFGNGIRVTQPNDASADEVQREFDTMRAGGA